MPTLGTPLRTIMAYPHKGYPYRIPYFSNTLDKWSGLFGDANNDNMRKLNENRG